MNPTPRVVHIIDSLLVGGREKLVTHLAIARGSENTSVICLFEAGPLGEQLRQQGFRVDVAGWDGSRFGFARRVWRCIGEHRPDVLHCHNLFAHRYGVACVRWRNPQASIVMTIHGPQDLPGGVHGTINRMQMRRSHVVAVSDEVRQMAEAWLGDGGRPVRVIDNGISLAPFDDLPSRQAARHELGLSGDAFLVGIVARLDEGKGHAALVDAVARLRAVRPNAVLVFVGDGPLRGAFDNAPNAILLGERQDVPRILAALDVFCLPSAAEGLPMAILEAMAASLPIVATAVGEIPRLLSDGAGWLVPPGDTHALDRALAAAATDRERGVAARRRVERHFTVEKTLAEYEKLYRETLT